MKETIKAIFWGNIFQFEKCGIENGDIIRLTKQVNDAYDKILSLLDKENNEIVEQYEDLLCELNMLFYEEYFTKGFEIGHKLAIEALK